VTYHNLGNNFRILRILLQLFNKFGYRHQSATPSSSSFGLVVMRL
jgi:hypothetical protein